jgi:hypothetical protein
MRIRRACPILSKLDSSETRSKRSPVPLRPDCTEAGPTEAGPTEADPTEVRLVDTGGSVALVWVWVWVWVWAWVLCTCTYARAITSSNK